MQDSMDFDPSRPEIRYSFWRSVEGKKHSKSWMTVWYQATVDYTYYVVIVYIESTG